MPEEQAPHEDVGPDTTSSFATDTKKPDDDTGSENIPLKSYNSFDIRRRRRVSSECYVELVCPEDLGVAFCTRVAGANNKVVRRGSFTRVFPGCESSKDEDEGTSHPAACLRCLLNWRGFSMSRFWLKAQRLQRLLKVSAALSSGYVLAVMAVEPTCVPVEAGPPLARLSASAWRLSTTLMLMHALNSVVYAVLSLPGQALLSRVQEDRNEQRLTIPHQVGSPWRTHGFWLDIVSLGGLLAELVHLVDRPAYQVPSAALWLMLLQVFKFWRIVMPAGPASMDHDGFLWGFATIFCSLLIFAHTVACALLVLGSHEIASGSESWLDPLVEKASSCAVVYTEAWYFAALSLTSVGYGDMLVTPLERGVNSFFLVVAQLFTAKVCADLTWLTSTCNHWEAQHQARRAQAWVALQHMSVPRVLQERVLAFQSYVATVHREDLSQPAFSGLSGNLMKELRLCAYRTLVLQAPFLREQQKDVISFIVASLDDHVFLPADLIVRSGDRGRELFFMRRGEAAVYVGAEPPCWGRSLEVACYKDGNYFGELGMLTGHPRAAWIMAKTYCVCSVLTYAAVEALGQQYPGAFTRLVQGMVKQYTLKSSMSWEQVSRRIADKLGFTTTQEAFGWFFEFQCSGGGTSNGADDEELNARAFEEGLRRLKVPPLDRKILWAEMDHVNTGTVSLEEFGCRVIFDPLWIPACQVFRRPSLGNMSMAATSKQTTCQVLPLQRAGSKEPIFTRDYAADREAMDLLQDCRRELAESRELAQRLTAEVFSLRLAARQAGSPAAEEDRVPESFRLPSQPAHATDDTLT